MSGTSPRILVLPQRTPFSFPLGSEENFPTRVGEEIILTSLVLTSIARSNYRRVKCAGIENQLGYTHQTATADLRFAFYVSTLCKADQNNRGEPTDGAVVSKSDEEKAMGSRVEK